MKEYHLLIVGNVYDYHLVRLIKHLKSLNPLAQIDIFSMKGMGDVPSVVKPYLRNIFLFSAEIVRVPYLYSIIFAVKIRRELNKLSEMYHYNVVNIHYPNPLYGLCSESFKKLADRMLITPWGSDVYRISDKQSRILCQLYSKADNICGIGNRFSRDVQKKFHFETGKFACLSFGSDMIDYINENVDKMDADGAKKQLGIQSDYVITCGYNGHEAQNHIKIIEAIDKVREQLPGKVTLLFPVTYPSNNEYIKALKEYVSSKNLKSLFFDIYLDDADMFIVRQATDLFIHMQKTDANSGSLQEYLLLGKKVVNAGWLRYDTMEKYGIPYYLASTFEELPEMIEIAYRSQQDIVPSKLKNYLSTMGWKSWVVKWNHYFEETSFLQEDG